MGVSVTNLKAITALIDGVQIFLKSLGTGINSCSSVRMLARVFLLKSREYSRTGLKLAHLFHDGKWPFENGNQSCKRQIS